jgi:hypothetical protein
VPEQPPLTKQELDAFSRQLLMLHESRVQEIYREAWRKCQLVRDDLPSPDAIQQLVRACKILWRWRQK